MDPDNAKLKFYEDKAEFEIAIRNVEESSGIDVAILEKDYYVCLFLAELSRMQREDGLKAYFKGGTALYKMLDDEQRFSEDIDITVEIADAPSKNQEKRRLVLATQGYKSLPRLENEGENKRGTITSIYRYDSVFAPTNDILERFGKVKVEGTSFTVSEPFESVSVSPMILRYANKKTKDMLSERVGFSSVPVLTITLERMFIDKIMASELCYEKGCDKDHSKTSSEKSQFLVETAKHLYDLYVLCTHPRIISLFDDTEEFLRLVSLKRKEEHSRLGSSLDTKPFQKYSVFLEPDKDNDLRKNFDLMQDIYVFDNRFRVNYDTVCKTLRSAVFEYLLAHPEYDVPFVSDKQGNDEYGDGNGEGSGFPER